ncbi:MAG: hypothetical protein Q8Q41_05320 [bacterium]|nr:hypothetical protein [bacterium]
MDQETPQPILPSSAAGQPATPKRKLWKFAVSFLAIIVVAGSSYWAWTKYLSPEAKRSRAAIENYERMYKGLVTDFEDAMKADTWGGKTPQETLDLFVAALKKGDVELASKYFHIETNVNDPNYLTKKKWLDYLNDVKERGYLKMMADDIEKDAQPTDFAENNRSGFELLNADGAVGILIKMSLNTRSGVWKIESL